MTTARSELVDPSFPLHYHLTSRCVRQSFLCGYDSASRIDYSYRKQWLIDRAKHLARSFAIEIDAYAIMSNHFHFVVYYDPTACLSWSAEEVAFRWVEAFPPTHKGSVLEDLKPLRRERMLENPELLEDRRFKLGSMSTFMQHLKHPISVRANKEDECSGHFFEQRFYSGAILSQASVEATMAYVELNPVRAKLAKSLEACKYTSLDERLNVVENTPERLAEAVKPIASGLEIETSLQFTNQQILEHETELLHAEIEETESDEGENEQSVFVRQVASIGKTQRAYGPLNLLQEWLNTRGFRHLEDPFPE